MVLTVDDALRAARTAGLDRGDAQWLLAALLQRPRAWLLAHGDTPMTEDETLGWQDRLRRHGDGEPLAYLAGWTEFHGLRLRVTPEVLVPRSDTETLVDWALELLPPRAASPPPTRVLDLGTGSGAIALAVKQARPDLALTAADASEAALAVAADNGRRLGLTACWLRSNWWAGLEQAAPFEMVLSNPPYIAEHDAHLAALRHEPRAALTAGPDGLDDLRRIIDGAPGGLVPGGWLLMEHGWDQASAVASLLATAGFTQIDTRHDLAGRPRCTGGRRP